MSCSGVWHALFLVLDILQSVWNVFKFCFAACLEAELVLKIALLVLRQTKSILVDFEKNLSWFIFVYIGEGPLGSVLSI